MAAALRRNPRSLLLSLRNPFASLSTAAAPDTETPPPPSAATAATKALPSERHPVHLAALFKPTLIPKPSNAAAHNLSRTRRRKTPPSGSVGSTKVLKAILSEPDLDRLVALFQSAAHNARFHFDPNLYSLTVRKLTRAGRNDLIHPLLHDAATHPAAPARDDFFARIIKLYSSVNMLDQAVRTFDTALTSGRPIADLSLCALLCAFLKAAEFNPAIEAFTRVPKQLNFTPSILTHNILLHILCKMGDVAAARQLLDTMVETDIGSYTTVLDGYLWKEDEAGADQMLQEIEGKGLVAGARTYNCRIAAFCRKEEMLKAEELLEEMAAKRVLPNAGSFKKIIVGHCKVGDMESALRVFRRKKAMSDIALDGDVYDILIRSLIENADFGSALEVCEECLDKDLIPEFKLVKELAEGLSKNLKVDEAKAIVGRMGAVVKDGDLDSWKKVESEICL